MLLMNYLYELKSKMPKEKFNEVLLMVEQDIKFNRLSFGKKTTAIEFERICDMCMECLSRC